MAIDKGVDRIYFTCQIKVKVTISYDNKGIYHHSHLRNGSQEGLI